LNRTFGFGFCAAIGRLGSTIMPYIVVPLVEVDYRLIFVTFIVVSIVGAWSSSKVPKDLTGVSLSENQNLVRR